MSKQTVGALVRFAAENFVAIDAEPEEKIFLLRCSFLDEARQHHLDRVEFPGMRFEIRMEADEVRLHIANSIAHLNAQRGEKRGISVHERRQIRMRRFELFNGFL